MYSKLINGIDRLSDANLESKIQYIISKMTGNAHFPTPSPTLTAVEDALAAFIAAVNAAKAGDKIAIIDRDQKREVVIGLAHELALYVMYVAKGDKLVLASSGFDVSKDREPAPPITKPTGLEVITDNLNAGEALVRFKRVPQSRSYLYEYTLDPQLAESSWNSIFETRSKRVISGLESNKRYYFRITAIGTGNQMMNSDVTSKVIQ